jgi:hypothetical protein
MLILPCRRRADPARRPRRPAGRTLGLGHRRRLRGAVVLVLVLVLVRALVVLLLRMLVLMLLLLLLLARRRLLLLLPSPLWSPLWPSPSSTSAPPPRTTCRRRRPPRRQSRRGRLCVSCVCVCVVLEGGLSARARMIHRTVPLRQQTAAVQTRTPVPSPSPSRRLRPSPSRSLSIFCAIAARPERSTDSRSGGTPKGARVRLMSIDGEEEVPGGSDALLCAVCPLLSHPRAKSVLLVEGG